MRKICQRMLMMAAKDAVEGTDKDARIARKWAACPDVGGITLRHVCEVLGIDVERASKAILAGTYTAARKALRDDAEANSASETL